MSARVDEGDGRCVKAARSGNAAEMERAMKATATEVRIARRVLKAGDRRQVYSLIIMAVYSHDTFSLDLRVN